MDKINSAIATIKVNRLQAEMHCEKLVTSLRKDTEFAKLECDKDVLAFKVSRMESQNIECDVLKLQLVEAKQKFNDKVVAMGYTIKDLLPQYKCSICQDKGIVNAKVCSCVNTAIYKNLRENCKGLITDIDDFKKVSTLVYDEEFREQADKWYELLKSYLKKFPNINYPIFGVCGAAGIGKTYSVSVLANAIMKKCYSTLLLSSFELNRMFLDYHLASLENKENIFDILLDADLLIIDDLGSENLLNNVTVPYLYSLLIRREKPIIITTNLSSSDLTARYTDRIGSRLMDCSRAYWKDLKGRDLRKKYLKK